MKYYVVVSSSHGWPAQRPYPVAVAPSPEIAAHFADLISTCGTCHADRAAPGEGNCYTVSTMLVRPPYVSDLPGDALEWGTLDADAWLRAPRAVQPESAMRR